MKNNIQNLVSYGLFAAMLCIFAPMSVPIGPIPISLTNLVLYIAIFIIGTKGTCISFVVYMLLGIVGLPVFSGYSGGPMKVVGPTGGYLVGFIPMIIVMGIIYKKIASRMKLVPDVLITILGMIAGTLIAYALGTLWFMYQMDCELAYALSVCVIPFIPFDLGKMMIANVVGRAVRKPLLAQNLIK